MASELDELTEENIISQSNRTAEQTVEDMIMERFIRDSEVVGYGWEDEGRNLQVISRADLYNYWIPRARLAGMRSPLIFSGVRAYELLVWGQGVHIKAQDDDINAVIQQFIKDNAKSFTSLDQQQNSEKYLRTDGNLFLALITMPDGSVQIRDIDTLQITKIVCNPDDALEHWLYVRQYTKYGIDDSSKVVTIAYPALDFWPTAEMMQTLDNNTPYNIDWNTRVLHTAVNKPRGLKYGTPEFLAAINWARQFERILEQIATIWSAFSAFALIMKVRADKIAAAKAKLTRVLPGADSTRGNISPVKGSTAVIDDGADLSALQTRGASTNPAEAMPYLKMVVMAFGLPLEVFGEQTPGGLSDSGRYKLLELNIEARRELWRGIYMRIFDYVNLRAVESGVLKNASIAFKQTPTQNKPMVEWNSNVDSSISMVFPPFEEKDNIALLNALIDAVTLKGNQPIDAITPAIFLEQVARALDIDISGLDVPESWPQVAQAVNEATAEMLEGFEKVLNEAAQ